MAGADGYLRFDTQLDCTGLQKGLGSISNMIRGTANFKLFSAGMDAIAGSIDGAVSRLDTLNAFPRLMQQMGFSAQEAESSINRLSEGVQGLPTSLDEIVSSAQGIALLTGDLDGATDTALALNNAFLASGSSAGDASRGLQQYVQMLSSGTVDMQSWRTLQQTMGYALRETATAFGFAGESAQNDLYAALKDGDITFDAFNAKLVELSEGVGGFAEVAQTAGGGIGTAMENWRTAVTRGVANIIAALDEGLQDFGGIEGVIKDLRDVTSQFFAWVAQNIPGVIDYIKQLYGAFVDMLNEAFASFGGVEGIFSTVQSVISDLFDYIISKLPDVIEFVRNFYSNIKPFLPLVVGLVAAFKTFKAAMAIAATIQSVQKALSAFKTAQEASTLAQAALNAVMNLNPFVLIATLIAGVVAALVVLWNTNEDFRNGVTAIWNGIKDAIGSVVNGIVTFFTETIPNAAQSVVDWFSNVFTAIGDTVNSVWEAIVSFFTETIPSWIESVIQWFQELPYNIGLAIGHMIGAVIQFGVDIWNWVTTELPKIISGIIDWFAQLPGRIWEWLTNVISNIIEWGADMLARAKQTAQDTIEAVVNWFKELPGRIWTWLTNTIQRVIQWGSDMVAKAKRAASDLVTGVVNTIKALPGRMLEIGKNIVQGIWNGISGAAGWLWDQVKSFCSGILDGIKGFFGIKSPAKLLADEVGRWLPPGITVGFEAAAPQMEDDILSDLDSMMGQIEAEVAGSQFNVGSRYAQEAAYQVMANQPNVTLPDIHADSGTIEVPVILNGREIARAVAPAMSQQLAFGEA